MKSKLCPYCKEEVVFTDLFLESRICPYCRETINNLDDMLDVPKDYLDSDVNRSGRFFLTPMIIDVLYWISVVIILIIGLSFKDIKLFLLIGIVGNIILRLVYESMIIIFNFVDQMEEQIKQAKITNEILKGILQEISDKNKNSVA